MKQSVKFNALFETAHNRLYQIKWDNKSPPNRKGTISVM